MINLYGMVNNNPIVLIDADGRILVWVVGGAVVAGIGYGLYKIYKVQEHTGKGVKKKYSAFDKLDADPESAEEDYEDYGDEINSAKNSAFEAADKFPHTIFTGPACYAGPGLTNPTDVVDVLESMDDVIRVMKRLKEIKCLKCCDDMGNFSTQIKTITEHMTKLGYKFVPNKNAKFGGSFRRSPGSSLEPPHEVNSILRDLYLEKCK